MAAKTIIIDHGSGFLKAGFSGCREPQMVLPNIVNYFPCKENPGPSHARRRLSLGVDLSHPETFSYPIERGRVLNWEGVEHIWSFVLQSYRQCSDGDCSVVITESPVGDPVTRRKTLEIMFELMNVPSLLLADQLEMSLYASGHLTGVVVDSGYGLTRVQPFFLGQASASASASASSRKILELGSQDLAVYLFKSLFRENRNHHNLFQMDAVTVTQLGKCRVPQSIEEALHQCPGLAGSSEESSTYHLPDGTPVEVTPTQCLAPEMFFSPHMFDLQGPSISQAVLDAVKSCEPSKQQLLLSHVVACGGNTMYPGFIQRLCHELTSGHVSEATLWAGNNRNFSVWLGASMVAQLSSSGPEWMTKEEYMEGMRL
ncbi:actin-like protein 8 [Ctenodactylus gundi]